MMLCPRILDVMDIQSIMGISSVIVYEPVPTLSFPVIGSGRLVKIIKKVFFIGWAAVAILLKKRRENNITGKWSTRRIFMMKLSKCEKEPIINWNEAETTVSIYGSTPN